MSRRPNRPFVEGERIGDLVVLERTETAGILCRCICGIRCHVESGRLSAARVSGQRILCGLRCRGAEKGVANVG